MAELQRKGISFALDDFGVGLHLVPYLKQFYFDILKIDGQFIRGVAHDPDNQVLTSAMISIAEQFDMVCVAESVETPRCAQSDGAGESIACRAISSARPRCTRLGGEARPAPRLTGLIAWPGPRGARGIAV